MSAPRLLDLFCGAGGCSVGYARVGFEVIGVDIEPHPDYPYEFIQADATALRQDVTSGCWHESSAHTSLGGMLTICLGRFDAIHLSPPCPRYSTATPDEDRAKHPDLIDPMRELVRASGLPYVIENVPGAPLINPIQLCGSSFGLGVRRHRLFESNVPLWALECEHQTQPEVFGVTGQSPEWRKFGRNGQKAHNVKHAQEVMAIDWMTKWGDLADAIPPAYTEHIGAQLLAHISECAA